MPPFNPGSHTHEQWIGLVQPVGLVVAPAVLSKLELFPNQGTAYLSARQRQLEGLLEERDSVDGEPIQVVPGFPLLATELLDWSDNDLLSAAALQTVPEVVLAEYGETLRPTHGVPKFEGEGLQALVLDLTALGEWGRDFDKPWNPSGQGWDATPQQRFERLLKETEHPIGILFNGAALRLVHAPRGESSGWLTMPLEPMAEVAGRPMLGALELLLGVDRLFGGNPEQRLPSVLAASRKNQSEVSTRLAEQVLEALWELLLGFDEAERVAQEGNRTVLGELPQSEEGQKHLYGGLITVLLRLVFLLYAEDEALMPADSLYGQHYSVSALADRLRQERVEHQGAMTDRRGGWAALLSLFRLVYDGGGADPAYLPARHGELFDPDAYPFLEGRPAHSSYQDEVLTNLPGVSDDVVEKVLSKLLWLDGERLSYRALDVEQIGSVYEGIMGFRVEQAHGPSVGITYRPPRQKITITVVVDAEQLLAVSSDKREAWLDEQAGVNLKLPTAVKRDLKSATNLAEVCQALDKRLSTHTPRGLPARTLMLQPTAERRRSGSHYTPRALTEPIVAEAFRPWLEGCNHQPTAEQILELRVCDPAMGSGAFLVAVCRYLAGWLVQAWERDGFPEGFRQDADKDTVARRLVAQRCLYGVDKNPFAVNLARLSLWLVTLSKDLPFTFVDHALKCGDSLVGYSVREIQAAMQEVQLALFNEQNQIIAQLGTNRQSSFANDSLSDESYDRKKILLRQQIKATEGLRQVGDLMVAAFFDGKKPKERAGKQQVYLAMLSGAFEDDGLQDSILEIRERLAAEEKGITPFHWQLEFPEVFGEGRGGFDVFVGNPPFVGGRKIKEALGERFQYWNQAEYPESSANADLSAFFFLRCFQLLRPGGSLGLIATNTIAQGDTRSSGLRWICLNGGTIYCARKRYKWPGVAAVVVSVVHLHKGAYSGEKLLDRRPVEQITAFLFANGGHQDPKQLAVNADKSFVGSYVLGKGFIFDDCDTADNTTVDTPSPLSAKEAALQANKQNQECIFPYMSGDDLNNSVGASPSRYVIDFRDRPLGECIELYPELVAIVEAKVKPERTRKKANGEFALRKPLPQKWWHHADKRPALYEALKPIEKCIAITLNQLIWEVAFVSTRQVFSHSLGLIASPGTDTFAVLQSSVHETWATQMGSTMGSADALRYTPSDCFETFPFPSPTFFDETTGNTDEDLIRRGREFNDARNGLMHRQEISLTSFYNLFHDPGCCIPEIPGLRNMHEQMDAAVLRSYGWCDVSLAYGYGLDSFLPPDDIVLPDALQDRFDSGELFFWDASDALDFQGQLGAYGAIGGRRKLPWRYRWPDAVRDDVLARLLALNAERYAEEVAMGLHQRGAAKAAKAKGSTKAKAGSSPEFELTSEPYQPGLSLF